jgi:rubrerythrin
MEAAKSELNKHIEVLGGYWKCEDCGLTIEDELFVCPECDLAKNGLNRLKNIRKQQDDLDAFVDCGY